MKWEIKKFSDCMDFFNGKAIKTDIEKGGLPIFGSNGIIGNTSKKLHSNGIIIGRVGAYCGSVQFESGDFWATDNTITVKAKEGHLPKFWYYVLLNAALNKYAGGAAQPLLTQTHLKEILFNIPPLPTQQKIASILSAYDDLIENNLKRIKLLEEAAQHLYREWFVKFRFPGWEAVRVVDGLPEGWERKKLGEVVQTVVRGISPKYVESEGFKVINQKCIRNKTLTYEDARLTSNTASISEEKVLKQFDILVNSTGLGTLGRVAQVLAIEFKQTVDSHVTIVRADTNTISPLVLGYEIKNQEQFISGLGKGSTNQTELSRNDLKDLVLVTVPSKEYQQQFEVITKAVLSQIHNLQKQNQRLKEARDLLLPRLMNQNIKI